MRDYYGNNTAIHVPDYICYSEDVIRVMSEHPSGSVTTVTINGEQLRASTAGNITIIDLSDFFRSFGGGGFRVPVHVEISNAQQGFTDTYDYEQYYHYGKTLGTRTHYAEGTAYCLGSLSYVPPLDCTVTTGDGGTYYGTAGETMFINTDGCDTDVTVDFTPREQCVNECAPFESVEKLTFSAIDDETGDSVFFEIEPSGWWEWHILTIGGNDVSDQGLRIDTENFYWGRGWDFLFANMAFSAISFNVWDSNYELINTYTVENTANTIIVLYYNNNIGYFEDSNGVKWELIRVNYSNSFGGAFLTFRNLNNGYVGTTISYAPFLQRDRFQGFADLFNEMADKDSFTIQSGGVEYGGRWHFGECVPAFHPEWARGLWFMKWPYFLKCDDLSFDATTFDGVAIMYPVHGVENHYFVYKVGTTYHDSNLPWLAFPTNGEDILTTPINQAHPLQVSTDGGIYYGGTNGIANIWNTGITTDYSVFYIDYPMRQGYFSFQNGKRYLSSVEASDDSTVYITRGGVYGESGYRFAAWVSSSYLGTLNGLSNNSYYAFINNNTGGYEHFPFHNKSPYCDGTERYWIDRGVNGCVESVENYTFRLVVRDCGNDCDGYLTVEYINADGAQRQLQGKVISTTTNAERMGFKEPLNVYSPLDTRTHVIGAGQEIKIAFTDIEKDFFIEDMLFSTYIYLYSGVQAVVKETEITRNEDTRDFLITFIIK